jgi:hypothetical protein
VHGQVGPPLGHDERALTARARFSVDGRQESTQLRGDAEAAPLLQAPLAENGLQRERGVLHAEAPLADLIPELHELAPFEHEFVALGETPVEDDAWRHEGPVRPFLDELQRTELDLHLSSGRDGSVRRVEGPVCTCRQRPQEPEHEQGGGGRVALPISGRLLHASESYRLALIWSGIVNREISR